MVWDRGPVLGENSNDNAFDSSSVVKNRDGSLLERSEWLIDAISGTLSALKSEQSTSTTVEENSVQQFSIAIYAVDAGAVASADIDITGISNVLMRSRAGGAFSASGITQPVFTKGDGQVSCDYQFLAAEWQSGDMYRLNVKGIEATVDAQTVYIPEASWSNLIVEFGDMDTNIETLLSKSEGEETVSSYDLPNDTAENTLLEITNTKRLKINSLWMDFVNLVNAVTIKVYHKIDGTNYRQYDTFSWGATEEDGVLIKDIVINSDWKITITSGTAQGEIKAIPYNIIKTVMEV